MNYIYTIILIITFPLIVRSQNPVNGLNDTIIRDNQKIITLKDVFEKPYLERFYSNNELDSIIYVDDSTRRRVYDNLLLDQIAEPNSHKELSKIISDNLIWPISFEGTGIVMVSFIVDTVGNISNIRAIKGIEVCHECNEKAIEVIKKIPQWKPAMIDNKKIPVIVYYPISFKVR